MSDERKKQHVIPPGSTSRLPATTPPRPTLPSLPTSSGAFWGTPTTILRKDTDYIESHAAKLRAMADQAAAFRQLVEERDALGLAIARTRSIDERCAHAYERERLARLNELRVLQLEHQLAEVNAKIALAQAEQLYAQYRPQAPATPTPPAPIVEGLTPADIRKVAEKMPEITPESVDTLYMLATALMAEKRK
jgi:hypothetical protein